MTQDEQLGTIRRICAASGIATTNVDVVDAVRILAREHAARAAMVRVLERADNDRLNAAAVRGMYTSEPIPGRPSAFYAGDRYYADEESARRARIDLDAKQRRQVEQLATAARVRVAEQLETRRAIA